MLSALPASTNHPMPALPLPPPELRGLVGDTDSVEEYQGIGGAIAEMMKALGLLAPGRRILDVGCGCGRVAAHLLSSPIASYQGFDRNPQLVNWASEHITRIDGRFRFQLVRVESPYDDFDGFRGIIPARDLSFPFANGMFDVALLSSVFTHMSIVDARRYLGELARVLTASGQVLASWFLTGAAQGAVEGLGYRHSRREQAEAISAAGFSALSLTERGAEREAPENPPQHEWFLLHRAPAVESIVPTREERSC